MPNWCMNSMRISHPDPAMMQKVMAAWNSGKFLSTLIPEPDYPGYRDDKPRLVEKDMALPDWYDWRVKHWGTKWDIGFDPDHKNHADVEGNVMSVYFDSAWSPPINAYDTLTDQGYELVAYYFEPGMDFCGKYYCGIDQCYTVSDKDFPEDIDVEMNITDTMAIFAGGD